MALEQLRQPKICFCMNGGLVFLIFFLSSFLRFLWKALVNFICPTTVFGRPGKVGLHFDKLHVTSRMSQLLSLYPDVWESRPHCMSARMLCYLG